MNQQLSERLDPEEVQKKRTEGKALTLQELCLLTGFGQAEIRRQSKLTGFPEMGNKVTSYADYLIWRRQELGLIAKPNTPLPRRVSTAGRSG